MPDNKPSRDPKHGFYLNQCWVSISDNHLYFDQCAIKLEPKVIQVLECLAENINEVVSKELLIKNVWKSRVVTDDSLVRCISVLRKHFKNNEVLGVKIDTVAKKGYRLCLVSEAEHIQNLNSEFENQSKHRSQAPVPERQTSSGKKKKLAFSQSVILSLALLAVSLLLVTRYDWLVSNLLSNSTNSSNATQYQRSVLLTSANKERYPDLSADGTWITYSKSTEQGMAIYVKSLTGLGHQQITKGDFYDHQPTFSPDTRQVIFSRITDTGDCEIRVISIIGGVDKKLADCQPQGVYAMSWPMSNGSVFFIDKASSIAAGKLNRLNLSTGQLESIQILPSELPQGSEPQKQDLAAIGIDDIAISHDGSQIAVTLSPLLGVEDVYISSLTDQLSWKRLSFEQTKIHGLAFSSNDQELLFSSNRTGTFSLWRANPQHWQPKLIAQGIPNISEISTSANGKIAVERWTESSSVQTIDRLGSSSTLVAEKSVNWEAVQSPTNRDIVFLSNRSGHSELWLKSNGSLRQLTNFQGPWLMTPSWSPDGRLVAFTTNQLNGNRLFWFDFSTQSVNEITQTEQSIAAIWHPKQMQLYYTKKTHQKPQVWRWDYVKKEHFKVAEIPAKAIKFSNDGTMYFTKANQKGIWALGDNDQRLITKDLQPVDWNNWLVDEQNIYFIKRTAGIGAFLHEVALDSESLTRQTPLENFLYFSGLSRNRQNKELWYARIESEDADIDLLTPNN